MPSGREIIYGLYGALRLLMLDRKAMAYFDLSVEGFWKSFFAAVLIAPGFVIMMWLREPAGEIPAEPLSAIAVFAIAYVVSWTAYPLIVHQICEVIDRHKAFIGYIVAFNWSKVIQMLLYLPVMAITESEIASQLTALLGAGVFIAILAYHWFIASTTLAISSFGAIGFVLLDLALGILIASISESILAG